MSTLLHQHCAMLAPNSTAQRLALPHKGQRFLFILNNLFAVQFGDIVDAKAQLA